MPQIGDFIMGKELGYVNNCRHIWIACPVCQKVEGWDCFGNEVESDIDLIGGGI